MFSCLNRCIHKVVSHIPIHNQPTRLLKTRTIEIQFGVPLRPFLPYNEVRNGGCLMNKKKKQYEHDATIFGICIILGIIGSNFIEYGIISILLGIVIGAFVARRPLA